MSGATNEGAAGAGKGITPCAIVLGVAQDAGYPAAGCQGECCAAARRDPGLRRYAACLALVDPLNGRRWLIDCTPDFREQLALLDELAPQAGQGGPAPGLSGILLTHAHIGHYAGLVHLGRECMDTRALPVYCMPRMAEFLRQNEPWRQLITLGQIVVEELEDSVAIALSARLQVTPMRVPHRGEHSETIGCLIAGPQRTVFYLPDIDGWEVWREGVMRMVEQADALYLDGTFYSADELPGRDMSEIPHPTIEHSLEFIDGLSPEQRAKIRFIHFNHTNPVLNLDGDAAQRVRQAGCDLARQGETLEL